MRLFRLPSYELFLRGHQAAALGAGYAVWKHTTSSLKLPGLYVYISIGIFLTTSVLQCLIVLYRNINPGEGHSRVLISKHHGTIRMSLNVPRPLKIKAGQYVNVWIPSISFWSFLQSHPFTIASWTEGERGITLDLMIEPRRGFTQKLFACAEPYLESPRKSQDTGFDRYEENLSGHAKDYQDSIEEGFVDVAQTKFGYKSFKGEPQVSEFRLALFSGPHGVSIPVGEYGKVLMIAAGSGIVAQLPYLKELVCGFNNFQVRTREIRLVWQLQSVGECFSSGCRHITDKVPEDRRPASKLIDRALKEDTNSNGYVSGPCFRTENQPQN